MELKAARIIGLTALAGLLAWGCGQTKAETADVSITTAVCEMCTNKIQTAIAEIEGVQEVNVDIKTRLAHVTFYSAKTNLAAIENAITALGYGANDKPADPAAFANLPDCCKAAAEHEKVKIEL
jgi:copper chaperone CopZ